VLRVVGCLIVLGLAASHLPAVAAAQLTLERSPNLPGGWIGQTGMLYANLPLRLASVRFEEARQITALPAFDVGMGLPWNLLAGARFAPQSPVVAGHPTEWEVLARYRPVAQARGMALDAATTVAWNGAAGSLDGELTLARWFGPLRLLGALRTMNNAYGTDEARIGLAGGAVLHPLPGRLPLAVAGDVGFLSDRNADEEVGWSAALQLGVSFTSHTLSLFATNTASPTIQGSSRGDGTVHFGLELTVPIPVARFVGWVAPRETAAEAVVGNPERVEGVVRADMTRYLFLPERIEIPAGTTIEWFNRDGVLHTVDAADGAWRSGPIEPGSSWRARFDRPGRYLYICGPHPFMKGEVLVR
jgi:plastocyanin